MTPTEWIEHGAKVFPCNKNKQPLTRNGFYDATDSADTIKKWWDQWPDALIGVRTGKESGFLVLDVDNKKGKNGFEVLARRGIIVPTTVSQQTVNGGTHYFFHYVEGTRSPTDVLEPKSGLDVRSDGGYIVDHGMPCIGSFEIEMAECPSWLLEELTRPKGQKAEPLEDHEIKDEDEVNRMLDQLDPCHPLVEGRDGWQTVMRATHHATAGADYGKEAFTKWSLRHPGPWDKDPVIEIDRDWASYGAKSDGNTTWGSIIHLAQEMGVIKKAEPLDDIKPVVSIKWDKTNKKIKPTPRNLENFLTIPEFGLEGLFAFDELKQSPVFFKQPPWPSSSGIQSPLQDQDYTDLMLHLNREFDVVFSPATVVPVVYTLSRRNSCHPVREFLETLKWDGVPRIDDVLVRLGSADDTEYTRAVTSKIFIGAVSRAYKPGTKFDYLPILEGPEGCRKSTFIEHIGYGDDRDRGWHSTPNLSASQLGKGSTDAITNCLGSWIIEWAETTGMKKADEAALKQWLSTAVDRTTLKYDKFAVTMPRSFIVIASINPDATGRYLKNSDVTGARRYWPIVINRTRVDPMGDVRPERDQLWAEAVHRYKQGEISYLTREQELLAMRIQRDKSEIDMGRLLVDDYLDAHQEEERFHVLTVAHSIWGKLNVTGYHQRITAEAMAARGMVKKHRLRIGHVTRLGYVRSDDNILS